jgi:hypothetical protein
VSVSGKDADDSEQNGNVATATHQHVICKTRTYSLSPEFIEEIALCLRARNISSHLSHSAAGVLTAS